MNRKHWTMVLVAVVATGALALMTVPSAGAQTPGANGWGNNAVSCTGEHAGMGGAARQGRGAGMRIGGPEVSLAAIAAQKLDMTVDEVRAAMEAGKTIEQLAQEKGIDPQVILDAVIAARKARLDALVAEGRLTEEQAATMLQQMTERLTEQIATPHEPGQGGQGLRQGNGAQPGGGRPGRGGGRP